MKYIIIVVIGVLTIFLALISRANKQISSTDQEQDVSGIKITMSREKVVPGLYKKTHSVNILIAKKDFSTKNINRIFRWYSLRHNNKDDISLAIVTDPELMKPFQPGEEQTYSLTRPYEAFCYRTDQGRNEFYRFSEDDPNDLKTVILKGIDPFSIVDALEVRTLENNPLQIRVKSFSLKDVFPDKVYNTFEVQALLSTDWQPIFTIRSNDRLTRPNDYLHIVNENIAYLAVQWIYAVTLDGGASWMVWDWMDKFAALDCCPEDFIQSVQIYPSGEGEMTLKKQEGKESQFYTKDFGKTWASTR